MSQRKIDRIGRRAQSVFKGWVEEADLLPHPPEHDRLGWDFLVEFQPAIVAEAPLDRQTDLKKVLVQVKATANSSASIRGKLSAFKALVDTDLPAFIAYLELRDGRHLKRARLLHIGEREIEMILRRVRELEADGRTDLHNFRISLALSPSTEIALDGSNLSTAIVAYIGSDSSDYAQRKSNCRQTCGYGDGSHTAALRWASSQGGREIVDLALGYLSQLEFDEAVIKCARFGIELEKDVRRIYRGTLQIEPKAIRRETITVRNQNTQVSLELELFSPSISNMPVEHKYVRLKNDFVDVKLHFGESRLNININLPYAGSYRIDLLSRLLKFVHLLSIDGTVLSVGSGKPVLSEPIGKPLADFPKCRELWVFTEYLCKRLLTAALFFG